MVVLQVEWILLPYKSYICTFIDGWKISVQSQACILVVSTFLFGFVVENEGHKMKGDSVAETHKSRLKTV